MKWDPARYLQFSDHRLRPFIDLTTRITAAEPRLVVDLGCGPGHLTQILAERWPRARVIGVDSSPDMVAAAQRDAVQRDAAQRDATPKNTDTLPNLSFEQGDIARWQPAADLDVLVSNAALHWVPGHERLLAGWLAAMPAGAWLAVQVPANFTAPSHTLMRQLAATAPWRTRLDGVLQHEGAVSEPGEYLHLLTAAGWEADVWETTYHQLLSGTDPVLDWVRGAALRPVLNALGDEAAEFEAEYAGLLRNAYPATGHGTVYPFRRIFCVGRKTG